MKFKFKQKYWIGISLAILVIIMDFVFFLGTRWFFAVLIVALNIAWAQFWIDFFTNLKKQKEIEEKFLEFIRNLVGTVKSGISIPAAIIQIGNDDYGELSKYTQKLSNQIQWGIPMQDALINFSNDTNNPVIKRAVLIIIEATESGGDIESVLDKTSESILAVKKMRQERKASTFSQMIQGYVVFFVFIAIMLTLQLKLFPELIAAGIGEGLSTIGLGSSVIGQGEQVNLDMIFFSLVIIQGTFAGIMIGKFTEGTFKQGLLHSLILVISATLIVTTIKGGI
jgi:archaeal flagellar protein FlaJ